MPRTGRGGKRQGDAQTAYSNRSDLNARGPQPITVAPGQAYGEGKAQADAQRAVPMSGTPTPPTPSPASAAPQQAPAAPPTEPGQGPLDLFAPAPHEHLPVDDLGPQAKTQQQSAGSMGRVASILDDAAGSPFATRQVQQLAAFARSIVQ